MISPELKDQIISNNIMSELEFELYEAANEALSLFDNYPQAYESIGTHQVLTEAVAKAEKKILNSLDKLSKTGKFVTTLGDYLSVGPGFE